jgi:hypothetical protein
MGWESRARGGRYYTRSRKVGGRVVREYVGGGIVGDLAARRDAVARAERAAEEATIRGDRGRYGAAETSLTEVSEAVDLIVRAALLAAGYHRHRRGEWRKRRGQAGDSA